MIKNITSLIKKEILNTTIDLTGDYSNIVIDKMTDTEILEQIPFVKTMFQELMYILL